MNKVMAWPGSPVGSVESTEVLDAVCDPERIVLLWHLREPATVIALADAVDRPVDSVRGDLDLLLEVGAVHPLDDGRYKARFESFKFSNAVARQMTDKHKESFAAIARAMDYAPHGIGSLADAKAKIKRVDEALTYEQQSRLDDRVARYFFHSTRFVPHRRMAEFVSRLSELVEEYAPVREDGDTETSAVYEVLCCAVPYSTAPPDAVEELRRGR